MEIKDWKPIAIAALIALVAVSLFSGMRNWGPDRGGAVPQQVIVQQPAAPQTGVTTAPVVAVPMAQPQADYRNHWGGGPGFFGIFPLLFFLGLIFLAFRFFGQNRHRWGGPGGGPGYGPPHGYYHAPPPAQSGQSYQPQQPNQPQQGGQPTQPTTANGDLTRPESSEY